MGVAWFTQRPQADKGQHPSKETCVERQAKTLPDRQCFGWWPSTAIAQGRRPRAFHGATIPYPQPG